MDQGTEGQPLTPDQRAYAVGQLTMLKTIANMIETMPIWQLDRAAAELDDAMANGRDATFTWGTLVRAEDLDLIRIFVKMRGEIVALRAARHARILTRQAKVQRVHRN